MGRSAGASRGLSGIPGGVAVSLPPHLVVDPPSPGRRWRRRGRTHGHPSPRRVMRARRGSPAGSGGGLRGWRRRRGDPTAPATSLPKSVYYPLQLILGHFPPLAPFLGPFSRWVPPAARVRCDGGGRVGGEVGGSEGVGGSEVGSTAATAVRSGTPWRRRWGVGRFHSTAAVRSQRVPARLRPTPLSGVRGAIYYAPPYSAPPAARCVSAPTRCTQQSGTNRLGGYIRKGEFEVSMIRIDECQSTSVK